MSFEFRFLLRFSCVVYYLCIIIFLESASARVAVAFPSMMAFIFYSLYIVDVRLIKIKQLGD